MIRVYIFILILGTVLIVFPFNLTLAQNRIIRVVDNNRNPIAGAIVRQVWYQYSLGVKGEEDFKTNSDGIVDLPMRIINTNLLEICYGAISNFSKYSINAGYSSVENIGIFANGYPDRWFHDLKNKQIALVVLTN